MIKSININDFYQKRSIGVDKKKNRDISPSLTLEAILNTAVDGIIIINTKGEITLINPAVETLFGYTEKELLGKNISILMPEPDHSNHDKYIHNFLSTGQRKIIGIGREVMGKRKDGSLFPFNLSVSEITTTDEGKMFTGVIHDISEQKRVQKELENLNEELENRVAERTKQVQEALDKERQLNEMKSRFVSMASHEFRTPLGTILSSVSLIERYNTPETQDRKNKHIERIKGSVKNLTNILDDFLSLDKLETGRLELKKVEIDLVAISEEIIEGIKTIAKEGQRFNFSHTGAAIVATDEHMIKNILINLLSNAVKYSHENTSITISTSTENGLLTLSVKDEGIGVPESEKEMMFNRFFRAKNALNIQGTGLGLNIVKKYIDLMEGTITFESELGNGTTFNISIPI